MPPYTPWMVSGMNPYGKYSSDEFSAITQRQNVALRDQLAREQLGQQQAQEAARSQRELQKMGLAQQQFAREASLAEQREDRQRDALRAKLIQSQQIQAREQERYAAEGAREQARYGAAQERYAAEQARDQARYDAGSPLRAASLRATELGITGEEATQGRARRKEERQGDLIEVDFGQGPVMITRENFNMRRQIAEMLRGQEQYQDTKDWRGRTADTAQQRYEDTREVQERRHREAQDWRRKNFTLKVKEYKDKRADLNKRFKNSERQEELIRALPGELGDRARAALELAGGDFSKTPQQLQLDVMQHLKIIQPKTFGDLDDLRQREMILNHTKTTRMQALYSELGDIMGKAGGSYYARPGGIAEDLANDPSAGRVVNNIAQVVKDYIESTDLSSVDLAALATAIADPKSDALEIIVPGYAELEIGRGEEGSRRDKIVQVVLGHAFGVDFQRTKRRELGRSFIQGLLLLPQFAGMFDDPTREALMGPKRTGSSPSAKSLRDQIKERRRSR